MKEIYTTPEAEIIRFETEDVVTLSNYSVSDPYNTPEVPPLGQ